MNSLKARVFTKNHNGQKFSLRRLRRMALRKNDNIEDASIEYQKMLEELKKGFKV